MVDTPITALIAACASVVSVAIPLVWQAFRERGQFLKVKPDRPATIAGEWAGLARDTYVQNGGPTVEMVLQFSVKATRTKVTVKSVATPKVPIPGLTADEQPPVSLSMSGGFFNDSLIQLSYRSQDTKRIQYGVVLLKLDKIGGSISGHYSGFSPVRKCLVLGTIEARRVQ